MNRSIISIGAFFGAIAVMLGAFGAHFLKTKLTAGQLQTFETGVRYQFYHAFALIIVGLLNKEYPGKLLAWSAKLFIWGTILFSGSLYVLCASPALKIIGMVTPLGGLCFIGGWLLMAFNFFRKN